VRRAVLGAATAAGAALVPLLLHAALGPRYGGELKVGVMELPATTEPGGERGGGAALVSLLAHETLVEVDEGGFPSPALAHGWSTGAGGREWTLRLWEGASFHDGRPVTAADVVRSLRRFLRSPSFAAARLAEGLDGGGAFRARQAEELGGLLAPDGRHVVLRFIQAQALPLAALAAPAAAVTSPSPPLPATCAGDPTSIASRSWPCRTFLPRPPRRPRPRSTWLRENPGSRGSGRPCS
jgi:ABC-type transport system substrate-binding protein